MASDNINKDDVTNGLYSELQQLLPLLSETIKGLKDLGVSQIDLAKSIKANSSVEIKDLNATLEALIQTTKRHNVLQADEIKLQAAIIKLEKENEGLKKARSQAVAQDIRTEKLYNTEIERTAKAEAKKAEEFRKSNSEYEKTRAKLNDVSKALIELNIRGREGGIVYKALASEYKNLSVQVSTAEEAAGRYQRQVGNYKADAQINELKKVNNSLGTLRGSINQLTREAPAFANSVNTGFMAISNNLPIFFDAIEGVKKRNEELIAQGEKTQSVFKQVAGAFFSWGTALSLGVTLLTLFGGKIVETISAWFSSSDAINKNNIRIKENSQVIKENIKIRNELKESNIKNAADNLEINKKITDSENKIFLLERERDKKRKENQVLFNSQRSTLANKYDLNYVSERDKFLTAYDKLLKSQKDIQLNTEVDFQTKIDNIKDADVQKEKDRLKEKQKDKDEAASKEFDKYVTDHEKFIAKQREITEQERQETILNNNKEDADLAEITKQNSDRETKEAEEKAAFFKRENKRRLEEEIEANRELARIREEERLKRKKAREEAAKVFINDLSDQINKQKALQDQQFNDEIDRRKQNIAEQQILLENGGTQQIVFEKQQLAQAQLAKQDAERRTQRELQFTAFIKSYTAYLEKDPKTALANASRDIALLEASKFLIQGEFIEGTEKVEDSLGKPNRGGNSKDNYVIAVNGKERILNPDQNSMIGNLSNPELASLAYDYNMGKMLFKSSVPVQSFAQNITASLDTHRIVEEVKLLRQDMASQKDFRLKRNHLNELVSIITENGITETIVHKKPSNYVNIG